MDQNQPTAPVWLNHLERDSRGFLVPAEAPWNDDGTADLAQMDMDRALVLGFRRACAVCGYPLAEGHPVYRAFAQGDAARIRLSEFDTMAPEFSGPGHLSCMLFSVNVCPHMREPTSRLGKDSKIRPGARRGSRAAVMGFADYEVMLATAIDETGQTPSIYFGLVTLVDDRPYRHGSDLLPALEAAVVDDFDIIDTVHDGPLYWGHSRSGDNALGDAVRSVSRRLVPVDKPFAGATIHGIDYATYRLPARRK